MAEKVILVDADDRSLGEMDKLEAHKNAKLHRAISVFIFNSKGQLLLQKRALNKYHSSGLWTNTACTHPRPDESNIHAAIRRLHEEMGIKTKELIKLFDLIYKEKLDNDLTEYEFDHVFVGFSDSLPIPEPTEVSDFKYVDPWMVLEHIQKAPDDYTAWFKIIIEKVLSELKMKQNKLLIQNITYESENI